MLRFRSALSQHHPLHQRDKKRDLWSGGPSIAFASLCLQFLCHAAWAETPDCQAKLLLKRATQTYGQAVRSNLEIHSTLQFFKAGKETESKRLREVYKFPAQIRFEYRTENSVAIVGTDGHHSWKATKSGPTYQRPEHFTVPMRVRYFSSMLTLAATPTAKVECLPGARDGRERLLITLPSTEMVFLDIDPQTGLIYHYQGESPDTGQTDTIEVNIRRWEKHMGVWVASEFETRVGGKMVTRTTLIEAKTPGHLPSHLFSPPHQSSMGRP